MTAPSVTEAPARTPEWLREERERAHRLAAHYELQGRPFIADAMTAYALDLARELEAHYRLASEAAKRGQWGRCDEHLRLGNALYREQLEAARAAQ